MSDKYRLDYLEKEIERLEQAGKLPKSREQINTEAAAAKKPVVDKTKKINTKAAKDAKAAKDTKAAEAKIKKENTVKPDRRRNPEIDAKKEKTKKLPIFWLCLSVYALILLIFSAAFLKYVNSCLVQYENAQSENAMSGILDEFIEKVDDGTIVNEISIPGGGEFEAKDVFSNMYLAQLRSVAVFSYEKDAKSYLTESPIYDIYGDGELVAKVTLSADNEKVILKILTIMDWEIAEISPVLTAGTHNYTISIPSNYQATVNGILLTEDYVTSEKAPEGFENVSDYVEIPSQLTYTVTGLVNTPEIIILNAAGDAIEYETDASGNVSLTTEYATSDISDERKEMAYEIARTWEDFLTNDLSGDYHGLATIQQYLIKDSYYWNLASDYAKGADIGMMADHTLQDPAYTGLVVDDYIEYTENCFSCHIYFEKNMYLTRANNRESTDTIDSVFYFVYYDDTDDGEDNPHWGMVDMIGTSD